MATLRNNTWQLEFQRSIKNKNDFFELAELVNATERSNNGVRRVSTPSASQRLLSSQSRNKLQWIIKDAKERYGTELLEIISDFKKHGRGSAIKLLREITLSMLDEISWYRILLVIIIVSAIISVIGLSIIYFRDIMSILWVTVSTWVLAKGFVKIILAIE